MLTFCIRKIKIDIDVKYKVNLFEKKKATENPEIKKRGTKNKICLSSSYKLTLKNIRTKIIDTSVKKIEPNNI